MKGIFPIDKFRTLQTPFYYYDTKVLRDTLSAINQEVASFETDVLPLQVAHDADDTHFFVDGHCTVFLQVIQNLVQVFRVIYRDRHTDFRSTNHIDRSLVFGGSNYNISFLIRECDKKTALQSLSDMLFNNK